MIFGTIGYMSLYVYILSPVSVYFTAILAIRWIVVESLMESLASVFMLSLSVAPDHLNL